MKNIWKQLSLSLLLGLSAAKLWRKGQRQHPRLPTPIFPIEEPEEGPAVLTKEVRFYLGETRQFVPPDGLKPSDPIVENTDKEWGFTIDDKTGIITITVNLKSDASKSSSHTIKFTGKLAGNQPWQRITCTMLDYSNKKWCLFAERRERIW